MDVDTTPNTKESCLTKKQLLCAAVAQRVFTVASRGSRPSKSMSRHASGGKSIMKMTVAGAYISTKLENFIMNSTKGTEPTRNQPIHREPKEPH